MPNHFKPVDLHWEINGEYLGHAVYRTDRPYRPRVAPQRFCPKCGSIWARTFPVREEDTVIYSILCVPCTRCLRHGRLKLSDEELDMVPRRVLEWEVLRAAESPDTYYDFDQ